MTVAPSSRDARGGCPRGPLPPPSPATCSAALHRSLPSPLPPPPSTLPPNFRPAFFGRAPAVSKSRSGSAASAVTSPARPACRACASPTTPASSPPASQARRLQSLVVGSLVLVLPPPATCARVNVDRSRDSRCDRAELQPPPAIGAPPAASPSVAAASATSAPSSSTRAPRAHKVNSLSCSLKGILRSAASRACAPARPPRSVSFCIPAPSGPGSRSPDGDWINVLSRRARLDARRAAQHDAPSRPSSRPAANRPAGGALVTSRRARRVDPMPHSARDEAAALRFKRRTEGLCSRCLAPVHHHRSSGCRDQIRCLTCKLSGHRERDCPLRPTKKTAKPSTARLPPRRTASSPSAPGALSWALIAAAPSSSPSSNSPVLPPPPPMVMNDIDSAAWPPLQHAFGLPSAPTPTRVGIQADELRAVLAEQAAMLRAELKSCIADTVSDLAASLRAELMELVTDQSINFGVAPTPPDVDAVVKFAIVNEDSEPSRDDVSEEDAEATLLDDRLAPSPVCEDVEGEMQQLLPCLDAQGQQVVLLDGEEVAHNDGLVPEGGELLQLISSIAAPVNLLLSGHDPVLISPGDEPCDGGFASDDDEDEVVDGKMEQLLPGLAELDQVELLLDGEEMAHKDGLSDDGDLARREFQPVADVIDADAEAATIGNLLNADSYDDSDDDDADDVAGTTPSPGIAIRCVADLFSRPAVPLLPTPIPPMPRAHVALPAPDRRSSRLAAKPQLPAVGKAQRVLHKKMGLDFGEMPLMEATKEFANSCKNAPLSDSAINGLRTLLRLNLPSMKAADEALIGLAGPGGCDFPLPMALDISG